MAIIKPQRFFINEHLDVTLGADGRTRVLVDGKEFAYCSFVLLRVSPTIKGDSIDEIIENSPPEAKVHERDAMHIRPDIAFMAHCSNIQAWAEHDYNTRLLDSRISFGLLKTLAKAGDEKATRMLQGEIMDRLEQGNSYTAQAIIASCGDMLDEKASKLALERLSPSNLTPESYSALENAELSNAFFLAAASDPSLNVRGWVAKNRNSPPELLEQLSHETLQRIREEIASNPSTPPEVLERLSTEPDKDLRRQVAKNPNAPSRVLERLSLDNDFAIRAIVGLNPSSPPELLMKLAEDNDHSVRYSVTRNDSTPTDALAKIAKENDYALALNLVKNPSTPVDVFEEYALSSDEKIRSIAGISPKLSLTTLQRLSTDASRVVRAAVGSNPSTPVPILESLAVGRHEVRWGVARNKAAPITLLRQISRLPNPTHFIWTALSVNPATPADVLAHMVKAPWRNLDSDILEDIARHPNATLETASLATQRFWRYFKIIERPRKRKKRN